MKLLFDENLSRKLVALLADLFPNSSHVALVGLLQSQDGKIWEYGRANDFVIVTADSDFYDMALAYGAPPKVIWLRGCNYRTAVAQRLIRGHAIRIAEFLLDQERAVLILTP